ncbi:hypothetical protein AB4346_08550 [Vibrio breoganii]
MTELLEPYLAVGLSMALLSLWKIYSGPAIAGLLSYSYSEMLMFNLVPAIIAAYAGWKVAPVYSHFFKQRNKAVFKPKLKKFMKIWAQYGQISMAVLAPVLVGIPTYTYVSRRLNQSGFRTFGMLILSLFGWSSLAYGCFTFLDLSQYAAIQNIIPASIVENAHQ